jgi:hypothetical protein
MEAMKHIIKIPYRVDNLVTIIDSQRNKKKKIFQSFFHVLLESFHHLIFIPQRTHQHGLLIINLIDHHLLHHDHDDLFTTRNL